MAHVLDLLRLAGFDLKAVEAICEAYSKARKSFHDTGDPDLVNEIIALRILSLAKQVERDPDRLRAGALAALTITPAIGPLDAMGRRRGYSSDVNKNEAAKVPDTCNNRVNEGATSCKGRNIPMQVLDSIVLDNLEARILAPERH